MPPSDPPEPTSRLRWAWWVLAYVALALGLVGIVIPGLPTVPFVLLSAYAAARGSRRLHARLLADRRFGPVIRDWEAQGAVSRRAKRAATLAMALASMLMFLSAPRAWMAGLGTSVMVLVAAWLWSRPEPR